MKKLLGIVVLGLLWSKAVLSNEFNWSKIATTADESLEAYFDKKSIKKIENYKYVWILSNVLKDTEEDKLIKQVKNDLNIKKYLKNKNIIKSIFIKDKLINLIIK